MPGLLKAEIVDAADLSAEQIAVWRAMIAGNPDLASPYFRPEFTRIAAAISPRSAVAVLIRDGHTVGFFPHQRRGGAVQPLGAPMNDYHGVIGHRDEAPRLEEVAALLNPSRMNVSGWVGPTERGLVRESLMTTLPPEGYASWYAERRRNYAKYFKDKERARRSLEAEVGPVRVEWGVTDPAMLDRLIELKREQYRRTSRHDVFACGWTRDLLHALMHDPRDGFGASMAVLWAGEKVCAIEYSLHAGQRYHFWFPAYEPELSRCSPGILLSLETMRQASEQGYRVFDFGFGGENYKKYFCNTIQTVQEAVILRPGLGASFSEAAVGVLNAAGADRGERLRTSVRRRWAAIEACETTYFNRFKGAVQAAQVAAGKLTRPAAA